MVTVEIICAGRLKEPFLREGLSEYKKRISGYADLVLTEVPDEPLPPRITDGEAIRIKNAEGKRILDKIGDDEAVILLDLSGKTYISEELAEIVGSMVISGKNRIVFVIGGTLGVSSEVRRRADYILALSTLTMPHQLARLVLAEQIYRIFRILKHEPYHR